MEEDRIISDDQENTIGKNIRWIRKTQEIRQTEMVARLQAYNVAITRESLVKIEGGRQHIKLSQLRGLRKVFDVSYDDLLDQPGEKLQLEAEKRREEAEKKKQKKKRGRKRKKIDLPDMYDPAKD